MLVPLLVPCVPALAPINVFLSQTTSEILLYKKNLPVKIIIGKTSRQSITETSSSTLTSTL